MPVNVKLNGTDSGKYGNRVCSGGIIGCLLARTNKSCLGGKDERDNVEGYSCSRHELDHVHGRL